MVFNPRNIEKINNKDIWIKDSPRASLISPARSRSKIKTSKVEPPTPPTPAALKVFKKELSEYKTGKGSVQFPYDKPLPKNIIKKLAAYRAKDVKENDARWM